MTSTVQMDMHKQPVRETLSKPTKPGAPRANKTASAVWHHAHLLDDEENSEERMMYCNYCSKSYAYHGAVRNMEAHLISLHSVEWDKTQPKQKTTMKSYVSSNKVDPKRLYTLVAEFFIQNALSFNVADSDSYSALLTELNGGQFQPHKRTALTADCDKRYDEMISLLKEDIAGQTLSITTDAATLSNGISYIAITGHYITSADWVMKDVTLAVWAMQGSHTGDYVSGLLHSCLKNYNTTAFGIVTDNGSNFLKAARQLHQDIPEVNAAEKKFEATNKRLPQQIRCTCHSLQLCLKDAVDGSVSCQELIKNAQAIVTAVQRSNLHREKFKEIQHQQYREELTRVQRMAALQQNPQIEVLTAEQAAEVLTAMDSESVSLEPIEEPAAEEKVPTNPSHIPVFNLVQSVKTRFNTICLVFTRLLKLKEAVTTLCSTTRELASLQLTTAQWALMEDFNGIFSYVKEVCDLMETSKTPTLSFLIPLMLQLRRVLDGQLVDVFNRSEVHEDAQELCRTLVKSIDIRWHQFSLQAEEMRACYISYMLDPRVRMKDMLRGGYQSLAPAILRQVVAHFEPKSDESIPAQPPAAKKPKLASRLSFLESLSRFRAQANTVDRRTAGECEVDAYLSMTSGSDIDFKACPLQWWKHRESEFPILAKMARSYLPLPASSAPSERVFSTATDICVPKRRRLKEDRMAKLVFMKKNLKLFKQLQLEKEKKGKEKFISVD